MTLNEWYACTGSLTASVFPQQTQSGSLPKTVAAATQICHDLMTQIWLQSLRPAPHVVDASTRSEYQATCQRIAFLCGIHSNTDRHIFDDMIRKIMDVYATAKTPSPFTINACVLASEKAKQVPWFINPTDMEEIAAEAVETVSKNIPGYDGTSPACMDTITRTMMSEEMAYKKS